MWSRSWLLLRAFGSAALLCFLVAFAPSTAWSASSSPSSVGTSSAWASSSSSSASSSAGSSAQSISTSALVSVGPDGSGDQPLHVTIPQPYITLGLQLIAAGLLVGGLIVFLLAALLVSTWGN